MEKKGAKHDGEDVASGATEQRHTATPAETTAAAQRAQPDIERETQQRRRQNKLRESLHAWIVHFDAKPSARPPASKDEE